MFSIKKVSIDKLGFGTLISNQKQRALVVSRIIRVQSVDIPRRQARLIRRFCSSIDLY